MTVALSSLSQVPGWVWLVLGYGLWVGFKAFGRRKVSLAMAGLLPLVFFALGLSSLVGLVGAAPVLGLVWLLAVAAGAALGWYFLSQEPLEIHRGRGTVVVPGTWTILVLFLVIFTTKFAYGYVSATNPAAAGAPAFLLAVFGLSGLSTGIVTGRTARLYSEYFGAPVPVKD